MREGDKPKPDKRPKPIITTSRPQNITLHNLNVNDIPKKVIIKVDKRSSKGKGKS